MSVTGKLSTKKQEIELEWTIDNFFTYMEEWVDYSSPDFHVGDSKWYLYICPVEDVRFKEYIPIWLWKHADNTPVTIEYGVAIKTLNNTIDFERKGSRTFTDSELGYGFENFIKRSELLQRKKELVPSGILTITCFIKVKNAVASPALRSSKLAKDLKDLYISKDICDVTLHVKDESIEAHRAVLAARSPVFGAMFRNDTLEKKTGVVKISDADPEVFKMFLNFLYCEEIEFSNCNVCKLYKISHKYDVPDLKLNCVDFLASNLTVENFCEALILSHQYEENELYVEIESFFKKNFKKIVSSDTWETFIVENGRLCNNLLKSMA